MKKTMFTEALFLWVLFLLHNTSKRPEIKDLNLDSSKEMHPVHKFSTDSEILKVEFLINFVTELVPQGSEKPYFHKPLKKHLLYLGTGSTAVYENSRLSSLLTAKEIPYWWGQSDQNLVRSSDRSAY